MNTPIESNTNALLNLLDMATNLPNAGGSAAPVLQDKTITANGSYSADSGYDGLGEVTVNVPVPSGYIKPSGNLEITENCTNKDVKQYATVTVNVAGSGSGDDTSGAILDKSVTSITNNSITLLGTYCLRDCDKLVSVSFPSVVEMESYVFYNCTALTSVNLAALDEVSSYAFRGCTALEVLDFPALTSIATNVFYNCSKLKTLILRSPTMCRLSGSNAFTGTPMVSGGTATGCKIFVPSALVSQYQANTNWSTLNCDFVAIEGSAYA